MSDFLSVRFVFSKRAMQSVWHYTMHSAVLPFDCINSCDWSDFSLIYLVQGWARRGRLVREKLTERSATVHCWNENGERLQWVASRGIVQWNVPPTLPARKQLYENAWKTPLCRWLPRSTEVIPLIKISLRLLTRGNQKSEHLKSFGLADPETDFFKQHSKSNTSSKQI